MCNHVQRPIDDLRTSWLSQKLLWLCSHSGLVLEQVGWLQDHPCELCVEHSREALAEMPFFVQATKANGHMVF